MSVSLKQEMIACGKLLWDKNLASGHNGNISARIDEETILITAHGTSLGFLKEEQLLRMKVSGELLDQGQVSSEKLLHTEIYKNFPQVKAVVHTHTTYTNGYFLENEVLEPQIFETKMVLGQVRGVPQNTPAVTDAAPVIAALKNKNIVVLRNHGVVAVGENHFDCFVLIQALEEAAKINVISKLYKQPSTVDAQQVEKSEVVSEKSSKKYKLFSPEQIEEIVRVVNADPQLKSLGEQTEMTMDLAVHLDETGQTYSFSFEKGRIAKVGNDKEAEFFINASETVWRAVFNQEIDPFVATTQKKMHLRGDFAKISKWYAPCSRVFELWQQVPIE
ncbi:MAG: class II aldolase/adducin family protein [Candidatus Omnitrophica bacterium]|nr:class II aldolase/adducin family protein [Candidatus Omnitrophota bacterium]